MLNKLRSFVKRYGLILPGDRVTVALSGGKDSVALLFALYLLKDEWSVSLEAAHFNHHLRSEESDRDECFVGDLCGRFDIPLTVGEEWVKPGEKGLEAAAREARYAFFHGLPGKIATAHTADDNAETVLLRMVRGTGLKGLGAIAPKNGNIIRPMLSITRAEIDTFLDQYSLPHVEDSSNGENDFLRNRIRHSVMPLLRQENPRIGENLSAMALGLRLDEAYLQSCITGEIPGVAELRSLDPALRRRYLERFLKESGIREPEQSHILQAEQLVFHWNPSAAMDFPGGVTVARQYDRLIRLEEKQPLTGRVLNGDTYLEELGLWVTVEEAASLEQGPQTFTVRPEGMLQLRHRQEGDRLGLPGGTKSLKKLFIDRKIPASLRDTVPVLCDEQGILGVMGFGADRHRQATSLPAVTIRFVSDRKGNASLEATDNGGKDHG